MIALKAVVLAPFYGAAAVAFGLMAYVIGAGCGADPVSSLDGTGGRGEVADTQSSLFPVDLYEEPRSGS